MLKTVMLLILACTGALALEVPPNLVPDSMPSVPDRIEEAMTPYRNVRSGVLEDWLPGSDGILITTRFGETAQVHRVTSPMGMREQLTFFKEPVEKAAACPTGKNNGFLFLTDKGGDENYQIFYFDLASGKSRRLTDGKSRSQFFLWSNSGGSFAYSNNARNGKDFDIYIASGTDGPGVKALDRSGEWAPLAWSPDDSRLLLKEYISSTKSHLYVFDIASGKLSPLAEEKDGEISYGDARWSKDGSRVFFTSDEWGEFISLGYVEESSGKKECLSCGIPWNVEVFDVSQAGGLLALSFNEDGVSKIRLLDTDKNSFFSPEGMPMGEISALKFDREGERLALSMDTPKSPGDIYVFDIKSKKTQRWTKSEVGGLDTSKMAEPELIHYPTFDKVGGEPRMIPAFYYKPEGNGPFPVVINIHGGPEAQERPYFSPVFQYWVKEMKIAVVSPNVRGSDGYGKSYLKLDNGFKRQDSVKDIGALLDWIKANPELDSSKTAVFGGSYGGFMVLASMADYPGRITAGVDTVGISNFVTFLESTKDYRRDLRRVEYGDERIPEMRKFQVEISPTTKAKNIKGNLFVVQGANDPRVPASEAGQIVKSVRESNVPVWYLLAKDEGHGFRKKNNRDYLSYAVTLFWEKFLLGE